jgi:hypothetical protein
VRCGAASLLLTAALGTSCSTAQGGNCKVCGEVDHLAKDCPVEAAQNAARAGDSAADGTGAAAAAGKSKVKKSKSKAAADESGDALAEEWQDLVPILVPPSARKKSKKTKGGGGGGGDDDDGDDAAPAPPPKKKVKSVKEVKF